MLTRVRETITSRKNRRITDACALSDRKERKRTGLFTFEGIKLFDEAKKTGLIFDSVFVTGSALEKYDGSLCAVDCVYAVTDEVYDKLTGENAPQGVFSVCRIPESRTPDIDDCKCVILLDGVADPGNLGTIIRCADAFGIGHVFISSDGVDLYSPKTVRACMGSLFRVGTTVVTDVCDTVRSLQSHGFGVYAAVLSPDAKSITDMTYPGRIAFVVGNEGHGVSAPVSAACDGRVIIPMCGGAESLNASVAASILMWEGAKAAKLIK